MARGVSVLDYEPGGRAADEVRALTDDFRAALLRTDRETLAPVPTNWAGES